MSELDANIIVDGQKAIATIAQSGDIVSSGGEIDATCVVQTANGDKEKVVKTYSLGGGGGGGGSTDGDYIMRVVDIDGTILKEEHLDEGETFTLPNPPTHERLTFVEWMSPLTITDNTVTVPNQSVAFGPIYTTKSGKHEFDIHLNSRTGLTVTFNMNGTKEWGDGTTDTETSHTYAQAGSYTIMCDGNKITGSLFNTAYNNMDFKCLAIRFATGITSLSGALLYLEGLRYISLPKGLTNASSMLSESFLLKAIILPSSVTSASSCINGCPVSTIVHSGLYVSSDFTGGRQNSNIDFFYVNPSSNVSMLVCKSFPNIKKVIVPSHIYIYIDVQNNYDLEEIIGYENSQAQQAGNFSYCSELKEIKFPATVRTVVSNAFMNCTECLVYDFSRCTAVPTLQNTNAFTGINAFAEIRVPAALYDSWKTANNWSTFADYIVAV